MILRVFPGYPYPYPKLSVPQTWGTGVAGYGCRVVTGCRVRKTRRGTATGSLFFYDALQLPSMGTLHLRGAAIRVGLDGRLVMFSEMMNFIFFLKWVVIVFAVLYSYATACQRPHMLPWGHINGNKICKQTRLTVAGVRVGLG